MQKIVIVFLLIVFALFVPKTLYAKELTTPSGIPLSEIESFVDDYVSDYIGKETAGAGIIIVKDNEVIFSKGYGYGDVDKKQKINPNTSVFEWGSISKLFVWVSVMQLEEQGKIKLDEDISDYLPKGFFHNLKYEDPITMLNLMNHTAGFEERIFDLGYATDDNMKTLEEGLKMVEPNQIYRPGEVVAYSNYSTSLAAYIVQLITEQEFSDYVEEHIFQKLGISDSSFYLGVKEPLTKDKVNGYELLGKGDFKPSTPFYMSMYPSGGINGTAQDLAEFARALMPQVKNSVLFKNENTLSNMLAQSYTVNRNVPGNAHGFWEYHGKSKGFTHGGNTASFSSNFHIVPEENFAVIVLTNQAGEVNLTYGLTKELVGEREIKDVKLTDLPDSKITEGKYITARQMESGFLNVYYKLMPLVVKSVNETDIEVSLAGQTAIYTQIYPNVYKMNKGHSMFIPTNVLYFSFEDGSVNQIHTSISDYLPMKNNTYWLAFSAILFAYCVLFFIISPFVLITTSLLNKKRRQMILKLRKWIYLLNIVGTAFIVNIMVLIIRMLNNSDRGYAEVLPQIMINYILTVIAVVTIGFILFKWNKVELTKLQKFFYVLTIFSISILIFLLLTWQFYS